MVANMVRPAVRYGTMLILRRTAIGLVLVLLVALSACGNPKRYAVRTDATGKEYLVLEDSKGRIIDHNPGRGVTIDIVPIVDEGAQGFDKGKYEADLRDCRDYAGRVQQRALGGAGAGGLVGGGVGAAVGSSVGATGSGAKSGAMVGAIAGMVGGLSATERGRATVMLRCLAGRGYRVLGIE